MNSRAIVKHRCGWSVDMENKELKKSIPKLPPIDFENNEPATLGPCSREVYLASNWIIAIDSWDFCDPEPLALMLRKHPIPNELRSIIADIVSGTRKPNKRAAAKLKFPAAHRLLMAGLYRTIKHDVCDATIQRRTLHDYHETADARGIEVIELRNQYLEAAKKFKSKWASNMGIGIEALDNLCDALDRKIKNYPNI